MGTLQVEAAASTESVDALVITSQVTVLSENGPANANLEKPVRIQFAADFGKDRGKKHPFVVEPVYDSIKDAALRKLKPKKSMQEQFLVLRSSTGLREELRSDVNLKDVLYDGAVIELSANRPATTGSTEIPAPPRGFVLGATLHANEAIVAPKLHEEVGEISVASLAASSLSTTHYVARHDVTAPSSTHVQSELWPLLSGDVRQLIRQAVGGVKGFVEREMNGYISFDYDTESASQLSQIFPDPQLFTCGSQARLTAMVKRECRGLLICAATGHVLARRLPKFFGYDELLETKLEQLPSDQGVATIKHDGSLVSPLMLDGSLRWAGKAGILVDLEAFVAAQSQIAEEASHMVQAGVTPIYEWCRAGPVVGVMEHLMDRLILVAARDMVTGEFMSDDILRATSACEVAAKVEFSTPVELIERVRAMVLEEGVVVHWRQHGKLVKIKSDWWTGLDAGRKHGGKDPAAALRLVLRNIPLESLPSTDVWKAVLGGKDDQMARVYSVLAPAKESLVRSFAAGAEARVNALDRELAEWAASTGDLCNELELDGVAGGWPSSMLLAYQRRSPNAQRELRKFLQGLARSGRVGQLEAVLDIKWKQFADATEGDALLADECDSWCDLYDAEGQACRRDPGMAELVFTVGTPGSGKTTWAERFYSTGSIIAADLWFERFNGGKFDPLRVAEAHDWCQQEAFHLIHQGRTVVVNNTNSLLADMYPYVAYAVSEGTPHAVKFAVMRSTDANVLVKRNVHNVPGGTIKKMLHSIKNMGVPTTDQILAVRRRFHDDERKVTVHAT